MSGPRWVQRLRERLAALQQYRNLGLRTLEEADAWEKEQVMRAQL
jgi:hypothetical protein